MGSPCGTISLQSLVVLRLCACYPVSVHWTCGEMQRIRRHVFVDKYHPSTGKSGKLHSLGTFFTMSCLFDAPLTKEKDMVFPGIVAAERPGFVEKAETL